MISVNMHEAKSRLSQLVLAAIGGEEVILCSKGGASCASGTLASPTGGVQSHSARGRRAVGFFDDDLLDR
jgi:antitoxin (DNA-binding transcriptional repressor) of toxin-antitoxin stability system